MIRILIAFAFVVAAAAPTFAADYGRCHDRAVKSCNAYENSAQNDRAGQGSTATHEAEK